jgi:hypothetical protein
MTSQNFEFLRPRRALLADLGGFAEAYAHSDPPSALLKLRTILEVMVDEIFAVYRLTRPYSENLNDLLNVEAFRQAVPEVVLEKLHAVRKAGNSAAHATKKVLTPRAGPRAPSGDLRPGGVVPPPDRSRRPRRVPALPGPAAGRDQRRQRQGQGGPREAAPDRSPLRGGARRSRRGAQAPPWPPNRPLPPPRPRTRRARPRDRRSPPPSPSTS